LQDTCRYDAAPNGQKPYRQKDGALLAVGALSDNLKQTEPYKSQLEQMLVQHVYPEFNSPVGHLRAKVRILDICDIKERPHNCFLFTCAMVVFDIPQFGFTFLPNSDSVGFWSVCKHHLFRSTEFQRCHA
jgi:hypothetical protein